ncbi:hypothetical protein CBF45_07305 [Bordetella sp. J329]|nr:hypothetical protein CBF45_07305 [Bordetella sp. J329]
MADKYQKLRADVAAAIAEARQKGFVNELAEQVANLLAERDALLPLAENYRYLRKNWQFSLHGQPVWIDVDPDLEPMPDTSTALDELIAALRSANKPENSNG